MGWHGSSLPCLAGHYNQRGIPLTQHSNFHGLMGSWEAVVCLASARWEGVETCVLAR